MSDLFGSTPVPTFLSTEQREEIHHKFSDEEMANFTQAYEAAYKKAYVEQERKNQTEALKPVVAGFMGADTPEKSLDVLAKHPEWAASKYTGPFVQQWMETQSTIAKTRTQAENSRNALEDKKRAIDWDNAKGAADQDTISGIDALPNQGWNLDPNGRKVSPSPRALEILNQDRQKKGLLPFGTKQTEVKKPDAIAVEDERQKGREKLEDIRAKNKTEYEKQRQQDRESLAKIQQGYKIDLEKMKLTDKSTAGKVFTEDEFVQRHFNTVFSALEKENSNPQKSAADADRILRSRFRVDHPAGSTTPAKTSTGTSKPAAPEKPVPEKQHTEAQDETGMEAPSAGSSGLSFDDFIKWRKP